MKFEAIASSSHGNAYLVSDGQTRILLECGLAFRTLQKAVGFSLCELDGVLVSHEHKDHARCAGELARSGQTVYMSCGTALALDLAEEREITVSRADSGTTQVFPVNPGYVVAVVGYPGVELIEAKRQFRIGTFDIVPFATYHDAAEPLGFVIRSREDGDVLAFATDTVNLRYRFPGLRLLAIEANYDKTILERCTRIPDKVRARITNTHMEIDTLCDILRGMDLSRCREVYLLHLSDATSHEGHFINKVKRVVPEGVNVVACGRQRGNIF